MASEYPARDDYSTMRSACLSALATFMHTLDSADLWLTRGEQRAAFKSGHLWLLSMQWLADEALKRRALVWKLRPKWHYLTHTVFRLQRSRLNPRFQHTFQEEDFMGKLAKLCRRCPQKNQTTRFAQRYLLNLAVRAHQLKRSRARNAERGRL